MAVDRGYVVKNNAERARLRALVTRLSDAELARPVSAGWTVSGILAHLAFWDQRIITLLDQWARSGKPPALEPPDVLWVNDAAKPMFLALAPRRSAEVCLAIADEVDRKVEALSDEMIAANAAAGGPLSLSRADHRAEHLDEIDQVLSRA
ncbi:MAG: maleylpyruvate isomerase N-terminal domain-containing protein [Candidatus Rokuibacteriota bacterium]